MTTPAPQRHGRPKPHGRVVLVVEDEVVVRMGIALELAMSGFTVLEACCADEALELLASGQQVDVVFSDIHMPGRLDGLGLRASLLRSHPHLPVIMTSGHTVPSREDGEILFVPKPYLCRMVIRVIRQALERGRAPETVARHAVAQSD